MDRGFKRRDRSPSASSVSTGSESSLSRRCQTKLSSVLVHPIRKEKTLADEAERKAVLESQRNDKQAFDRNRRMFGLLMGTLQKFKTEETGRETQKIKRFKIEEKLSSIDNVTESIETILERPDSENLVKQPEVPYDLRTDTTDRLKNWENTHRHLCGFIQTSSKPKIFWLPKEHTATTEKKLKETRDYFSLCIAERTAKFKKEIEQLNVDTPMQIQESDGNLSDVADNK